MSIEKFDLEDKVVWESLAPSLQEKFVFTDYDYNMLRMIKNGQQDQILKVSVNNHETNMDGYLYADDNFHIVKTARTANDVAEMKKIPLSDQSIIINNWFEVNPTSFKLIARNPSNFNYIKSNRKLQCGNGIHALISDTIYPNKHDMYIKFVCKGGSGYPAVILSAYKSQNGTYHDISIIRTGNQIKIVFDEFCSTSNKKVLATQPTDSSSWSNGSSVYMQIKREYCRVTVSSGRMNGGIEQFYYLKYDMPAVNNKSTAGFGFNPIQFKYASKLFRDDKQIGVGVHNFPCDIYFLNGINTDKDDQIYYLTDREHNDGDEVYMPEGNGWVTRADYFEAVPDRTFLFNPYTNQLYWFKNMGNYYEISIDGFNYANAISSSSYTGELIKFDGNNNAYTDSGFKICYCVNTDDTLNMYKQDTSFNDKIYALHKDEVWQYGWDTVEKSGNTSKTVHHNGWTTQASCTNSIKSRTFLYNPDLNTLYFYFNGLDYTPIYAE